MDQYEAISRHSCLFQVDPAKAGLVVHPKHEDQKLRLGYRPLSPSPLLKSKPFDEQAQEQDGRFHKHMLKELRLRLKELKLLAKAQVEKEGRHHANDKLDQLRLQYGIEDAEEDVRWLVKKVKLSAIPNVGKQNQEVAEPIMRRKSKKKRVRAAADHFKYLEDGYEEEWI